MIKKLNDICSFVSGYAWKSSEFTDEGIPIIRINNLNTNDNDFVYWQGDYDKRYLINKGDLLVSISGTIKAFRWNGPEALLNQRIVKVVANPDTNQAWVYYQILYVIEEIANKGKHAVIKNVSVNDLKNFEVDVPDIQTQNKIVAILDKTNALVQKRQKTIDLLDELLRAHFWKMFGDPVNNPKGWDLKPLIDLCDKITDGTHKTPQYLSEGVPFISAKNIKKNKIVWDDIKYLSEEEHLSINKRCDVEEGDILLTKSGSLGEPAIIDVAFKFSVFESLALIKFKREVLDKYFLVSFLKSSGVDSYYKRRTKGVAIKHLHLIDIKSIPTICPPIELQKKYGEIYANVTVQENRLYSSMELVSELSASIMNRAYSGKLDFDVSVELDALLEEIDLHKPENDLLSIITNEEYLSNLVNRLNNQKFKTQELYDKARYTAFQLLKSEEILTQEYNSASKSLKLVVK